ncbi:unnamed protein product, partial [Musa banksii]
SNGLTWTPCAASNKIYCKTISDDGLKLLQPHMKTLAEKMIIMFSFRH